MVDRLVQINDELIAYLEELSCLALSDDEKIRIAGDLQEILRAMDRLAQLDTGGLSGRSHPFDNTNAFREDEAVPSFDRALILKNAPAQDGRMFLAPKTVD